MYSAATKAIKSALGEEITGAALDYGHIPFITVHHLCAFIMRGCKYGTPSKLRPEAPVHCPWEMPPSNAGRQWLPHGLQHGCTLEPLLP